MPQPIIGEGKGTPDGSGPIRAQLLKHMTTPPANGLAAIPSQIVEGRGAFKAWGETPRAHSIEAHRAGTGL